MKKRVYAVLLALTALPLVSDPATASDDGDKNAWTMATKIYGDRRARRIGDLVTVVISEENTATKDAKNKSDNASKFSGTVNFGHPVIDAQPTAWTNAGVPKWSVDTTRSFEGGGSLANKDSFSSKLTARVTEVLPNGNLLIEGKRTVILQDESVDVILTGVIRPADIAKDNTVMSSAIADATIKYGSGGPIAKNQQRGILTRVWEWVNPF